MSLLNYDLPVKRIKKKVARKLSTLSEMSDYSCNNGLKNKGLSQCSIEQAEQADRIAFGSNSESESQVVKEKYGLDFTQLVTHLERELSSQSDDGSKCWTPEGILTLVDSLRVPLELLVKIIQAVKSTLNN